MCSVKKFVIEYYANIMQTIIWFTSSFSWFDPREAKERVMQENSGQMGHRLIPHTIWRWMPEFELILGTSPLFKVCISISIFDCMLLLYIQFSFSLDIIMIIVEF